jgi:hypothetical protein
VPTTDIRPDDAAPRSFRLPWILRACAAGLAASALSATVGTFNFLANPRSAEMDWTWLAPALVLFVVVTGLSLGLGVAGGMMALRGRAANPPGWRLVLGASVGGALASVPPGILGIAGFGSQPGPYAGTLNIVGCSLLCATVFVTLWAPRVADRHTGPRTAGRRIALASAAALVAALSFAALAGTLVAALDLEPSFGWLKATARDMGLVEFSIVAAAGLGAIFGAFIGAATSIYVSLATVLGSPASARA